MSDFKKLGLVKKFAFFSFVAFMITGIGLIYIISKHIEKDAIGAKLKMVQYALNTSYRNENDLPASLENNLITLNSLEYYIWNNKGSLISSFSNNNTVGQTDVPHTEVNFPRSNKKEPVYVISESSLNKEKQLVVRSSIVSDTLSNQYYVVVGFSFEEIQIHIDMLVRNIVLVIIGGLLLLYVLLLRIISNASLNLIKQKNDLDIKNKDLIHAYEQLNWAFHSTVKVISNAVDARDPYTAGHSNRVMDYSELIGRKMNMAEDELEQLRLSALMHDIGKIGISDSILHKPSKLTDEEYGIIKSHPEIGTNILKNVDAFHILLPSILHHHERYDGKGYPRNLSGELIPLNGRIIAVADAFDAMTTNRPYRTSLTLETALNEIEKNKGQQFDPYIATIFIELMNEKK